MSNNIASSSSSSIRTGYQRQRPLERHSSASSSRWTSLSTPVAKKQATPQNRHRISNHDHDHTPSASRPAATKLSEKERATASSKGKAQATTDRNVNEKVTTSRNGKETENPSSVSASTSTPTRMKRSNHEDKEILSYTMRKDAIAPCFIKDIYDMVENNSSSREADFYWLGRVPCRTVHFVGLVIGVQVYEKRAIYTVDDGTAVIDCTYRYPPPPASPPNSKLSTFNTSRRPPSPQKPKSAIPSAYVRSVANNPPPQPPPVPNLGVDAAEPPPPIARVGMSVRVTGRVVQKYEKTILVDTLEPCKSVNEEPEHWLRVCDLHRTSYRAKHLGPFVIPKLAPNPNLSSLSHHLTQLSNEVAITDPQTPSKCSTYSSSAASTPSLASSPVGPRSPPRLRHPSRLHTRDLTANTFRIYLKHYMDNVPPEFSSSTSNALSSDEEIGWSISRTPGTPTKRKLPSSRVGGLDEETPRPAKRRSLGLDSGGTITPKASTSRISLNSRQAGETGDEDDDDEKKVEKGFTLSHLRRVPELALLARRVIEAEAKRRAREEKKKAKEQAHAQSAQGKGSSKPPPSSFVRSSASRPIQGGSKEKSAAKMKRLFRFAIRQLYDEGSIVLHDGPKRGLPSAPLPSLLGYTQSQSQSQSQGSSHRLWKSSVSSTFNVSSVSRLNTTGSSSYLSGCGEGDADNPDGLADLSDPNSDEEAYISLSPAYLSIIVERAITEIMNHTANRTSANARARAGLALNAKGPTPGEIAGYLQKKDDRWAKVGEWTVKEALEWGKERGRVWCIGGDRWEVCG
ncbi:hypothetical protein K474DRAFT_1775092 [Panus rudis PR-1116 ss-1]|nr:hypothetical protein K474DRAFT_1775092 [Panus rudis PR-1116 ss-1]